MDEMNNMMVENETSMETNPVEVVPASAVDVTYDENHESDSGINPMTIVKGVAVGVAVGVAIMDLGVKYGVPTAKKAFNYLMGKVKPKKTEEAKEVESEETSDEE